MSRSYKKRPYNKIGYGIANWSDKYFKTKYNRSLRHEINNITNSFKNYIDIDDVDDIYLKNKKIEYSNMYDSAGDGSKRYIGKLNRNKIRYEEYWLIDYKNSTRLLLTKDNINNYPEYLKVNWIMSYIESGGYCNVYHKAKYILMETYDEAVNRRKELYKKIMRK